MYFICLLYASKDIDAFAEFFNRKFWISVFGILFGFLAAERQKIFEKPWLESIELENFAMFYQDSSQKINCNFSNFSKWKFDAKFVLLFSSLSSF